MSGAHVSLFRVTSFDLGPVHDLPQCGQMRRAAVLVVEVVGVLPDIKGQQGFIAFGDGVVGIGFLRNHQSAVRLS